ncbi:MAG: DUF805 domain-containing protein [Hyphomicrobium sp.]|nr:DUF805 domain-containing protein [Hyphomicrobium sp.]
MNIFELLLGFQGRINRWHWWLGQFALAGLIAIFMYLLSAGAAPHAPAKAVPPNEAFKFFGTMLIATAMLSSALVWVAFSLAIKRLHDRSQSGWKALVFGVPVVAAFVMPNAATQVCALAAIAWYVLEFGCLRGDPLHNKYGPATTPDSEEGAEADDDIDPLQLSVSENIARSALKAAGNRRSTAGVPSSSPARSSATAIAGGSPTAFGRRAH